MVEHEVREVPLSALKRAPYNPRTISEKAKKGLGASLKRFGVLELIVWNERTGHVVGGHQRLDQLEAAGAERTKVVVVDLDEGDERAANVTLNNPAIAGAFTDDLPDVLAGVLEALGEDDFAALQLDALLPRAGKEVSFEAASDLTYAVQVECSSETDQREVLDDLEKAGRKCKPLIW